jgi:hypothetical protein
MAGDSLLGGIMSEATCANERTRDAAFAPPALHRSPADIIDTAADTSSSPISTKDHP